MEKQQLKSPVEILKNLEINRRATLQKMPIGSLIEYHQKNGAISFSFRYNFEGKDLNEPNRFVQS
mgnify:FL=1